MNRRLTTRLIGEMCFNSSTESDALAQDYEFYLGRSVVKDSILDTEIPAGTRKAKLILALRGTGTLPPLSYCKFRFSFCLDCQED